MLFAHLDERLRNVHPGVVDEDVDALEPLDAVGDLARLEHVAHEGARPAAAAADLPRESVELRLRPRDQHHFGAGVRERDGAAAAQAAARAGHDAGETVEAQAGRARHCLPHRVLLVGHGWIIECTTPAVRNGVEDTLGSIPETGHIGGGGRGRRSQDPADGRRHTRGRRGARRRGRARAVAEVRQVVAALLPAAPRRHRRPSWRRSPRTRSRTSASRNRRSATSPGSSATRCATWRSRRCRASSSATRTSPSKALAATSRAGAIRWSPRRT